MVLTTAAVLVGIVVGLLRGGRPPAVRRAAVRWWPVLPVGLAVQGAAEYLEVPGRLAMLVAGLLLLLVWAVRNTMTLPGTGIIAVGLAGNLAAVVANGHIPIRWASLVSTGRFDGAQRDLIRQEGLYRLETDGTVLAPLGDIVPLPVLDEVLSFGDLIILAGVVVLVSNLLLVPRRRRRGISPEELFVDDPIGPARQPRPVLDLREPLPDWSDHPVSSRSTR